MDKTKNKGNNIKYLPFLIPSLAGTVVFTLLPFVDSLRRSFFGAVSGKFIGTENYKAVFENEAFCLAVKNTAMFTAVCLPILIGLSFIIACLIDKLKYMKLIRSVLLFPMAVPTAALVLVWKLLFDNSGIINGVLERFGFETVDFLESRAAFFVLVGSYIWKNLGCTVLLWLTGISAISPSISEAAQIDGANRVQTVIHIILPNLRPTLYTITVLSFLSSFKVFREAYLVAGAYPHESIYLLQHLFNNWFSNFQLDKMAAATVLVFAVIFIAVSLLQRAWDKEDV
ncbi:sugar ABC transporter permease [Ruminococcus sp.]|uniref:carbohydrate ABC transporter permease n=1 Tax=Ruminococcus sp. TaxID=41978 RepID=UPI00258683E9|nr:sugar ABC transporter permease [Ruminococcus sp.]MCR5020094.1 sugar ABC transporter permease [Ruminococcus sp.]